MEELKKNMLVEGIVEGYTAEGMGVARINGMAVFISGGARGDHLSVRIVKVKKNYAYGRIERIIKPSEMRVEPCCPHYSLCGGCSFLHLSYQEELWLKGRRVEDALRRMGGVDITVGAAHASCRQGYRNKAQFLTCQKDGRAAFGLYRARSHHVVPIEGCHIQSPSSNRLAAAVCRWMDASGAAPYDEDSHCGLVRRIYVREGQGGRHLCIVANGDSLPRLDLLISIATEAEPSLCGIVLNINKDKTNRIMGEECRTLWGSGTLRDSLMGLEFQLSPLSFYQVNHTQAERLYQKALEYAGLGESDTALDLYCGAGTITLLLAGRCKKALGNEIVPQAVENARENARRNGVENVEFILGDAGQAAAMLALRGLRPDVIVTDPPRKGMDIQAVDAICRMEPKRVVYVSCDPASLARDCARMAERGYRLDKAEAFDMFPGTANIETVALLTHNKQTVMPT